MSRFGGRVALVTGADSGIGAAIALRLARDGADVAVNHVGDPEAAERFVEQVRAARSADPDVGRAVAVQADVSDEADVVAMVGEVVRRLGRLDLLVNNAGIQVSAPSEALTADDFDRVLAVAGSLPVRP
jgi:NAD(P)-dependent dehydrogenase (short-subunit alcohol dehydrogenase family)